MKKVILFSSAVLIGMAAFAQTPPPAKEDHSGHNHGSQTAPATKSAEPTKANPGAPGRKASGASPKANPASSESKPEAAPTKPQPVRSTPAAAPKGTPPSDAPAAAPASKKPESPKQKN